MLENFKTCKIGDLITVNDFDLVIELNEDKKLTNEPKFLIKDKRIFDNGKEDYRVVLILDHIGTDIEKLLVLSAFNTAYDIKIYTKPDFFTSDRRSVIGGSDLRWILDDEGFPQEIYEGDDIIFVKKVQNEVFGEDCMVEWVTEAKVVNYELLVIETGSNNVHGGWIEFYEGRLINEKDVSF